MVQYHILRHFFGISSYWPYIAVVIAVHLIAAHILWRIAISVGASRSIVTALIAAFAVVGAGSENLLWAFQIAFVGPLALGGVAILLLNHQDRSDSREVLASCLLIAAVMFSGIGLVMVGAAAIVSLFRSGLARAGAVVATPLLLYTAWRVAYPADSLYAVSGLREFDDGVGPYVVRGLFGGLTSFLFSIPGAGAAAAISLAVYAIRTAERVRGRAVPAYALALASVALLVLLAYGRLKFGIDQAASSRYTYLVVALLAPIAALALSELTGRRASLHVLVLLALVGLAAYNVQVLRDNAGREAAGEAMLRRAIFAAAHIASDPQQPVFPGSVGEPALSGALTSDDLRRWARGGELPPIPKPGKVDEMTAATHLQVSVEGRPRLGRPRCDTVGPGDAARLDVSTAPGQLVFESSRPVSLQVQLTDRASKIAGAPRGLLWSGGPARLVVLRQGVTAYISPQNGPIRVCK